MKTVLLTGKNGIPKLVTLKSKVHRQCVVPYKREGNGMRSKRRFKSQAAADNSIDQKHFEGYNSYKCDLHDGWHIGHVRKTSNP